MEVKVHIVLRTFYLSDHFLKCLENRQYWWLSVTVGDCRRRSATVADNPRNTSRNKSALLGFHTLAHCQVARSVEHRWPKACHHEYCYLTISAWNIVVWIWFLIFSDSHTLTALTVKNVLSELTALDWKTISSHDGVLFLPRSQQNKIEMKFLEEDQCKTAGVILWLTSNPFASWRWLIWSLDWKERYSLSEQLHPYAEKLTGMRARADWATSP